MQSVFYSYAQTATMDFVALMGARVFDNPKNWKDLARLIRYLTFGDDIVMDFFAGSASTAHGVIAQNAEDGCNRKFIMIQIPESCRENTTAFKEGFRNIAEIAKERIRKAGRKIKEEAGLQGQNLDIGFRVLKVDTSNMNDLLPIDWSIWYESHSSP